LAVGLSGCTNPEPEPKDTDGDGVKDEFDVFPNDPDDWQRTLKDF